MNNIILLIKTAKKNKKYNFNNFKTLKTIFNKLFQTLKTKTKMKYNKYCFKQ